MTILAVACGVVLLLLLLADVHLTVFVPRGGAGVVSRRIYSAGWSLWRGIGNRWLSGSPRRRWWLAQYGALLVPTTIIVWGTMLVASFALIYTWWLDGFTVTPTETGPMPDWALTLYYSGLAAVTLGTGDVVPSGTVPRLLAFIQAAIGFVLLTASVSYLLSVYNARSQSTTLALYISQLAGNSDGEDSTDLLVSVTRSGSIDELGQSLERISADLAALVEMSGQYPQVQYFHEPKDDRSLPLALDELLRLTSTCQSMIDPEVYPTLVDGPQVRAAYRLSVQFLEERGRSDASDPGSVEAERRPRYDATRDRLLVAGVKLRDDDDAWERYRTRVRQWDTLVVAMCERLGYRSPFAR